MRLIHLVLALISSPVAAANLIGMEVPPYPDNLEEIAGACVGGPPRTADICDYSIGILGDPEGTPLYLYAGKFLRRGDKGHPYWRIIDAIPYPKFPKGYDFTMSGCRQNGVEDSMIVAVVKITDEEWHTEVREAYRLDIGQQKFVTVEPKGVECLNEGWGL